MLVSLEAHHKCGPKPFSRTSTIKPLTSLSCVYVCLPPLSQCVGGGPKRLRVLLEGESLLNDASGLTLFEVFFHIVSTLAGTNPVC